MAGPIEALDPARPLEGAADVLLKTGILGALLIFVGAFAFWAVWKWNKANEARVKDQKELSEKLIQLTTSLNGTLSEMTGTLDAHTEALKANTKASESMERSINETVRDAMRALKDAAIYARRSSSSGSISATRSPTPPLPPKST